MVAKQAKNLPQLVNYIDPDSSIEDAMAVYYVNRGDASPIKEMITHLLTDSNFPKLLFTGPKGCGKETELIKLSKDKQIKKKFHVRIVDGKDEPGKLADEISKKVIAIAKTKKIDVAKIEEEIDTIKKNVEGWVTQQELAGVVKQDLPKVVDFGKIKPEEKSIKVIRKKEGDKGKAPDYKKYISQLTEKIYWSKKCFRPEKREVLILVTNLDKIKLEKVKDLFLNDHLTKMDCFVIYTFPFAATRQDYFPQILRKYSDIYHFTNLNPNASQSLDDNSDYNTLKKILTKRVNENVFNPIDIIDDLIKYSMGVPYELLRLVKECGLLALRRRKARDLLLKKKIDYDVLAEILQRNKILYQHTLPDAQKEILRTVNDKKEYSKIDDNKFQELIDLNLIAQYGPIKNIWDHVRFDINPIIRETFPELEIVEKDEQKEEDEE